MKRVLIIRDAPLRGFVQALGAFAAIRAHHPRDSITLLTTKPFAELAWAAPWFDEVWLDDKPTLWQAARWMRLAAKLRDGHFARVYDLQNDERSGWYFQLMGRPQWSGSVAGCSHPHTNPRRDFMHPEERLAEQLQLAGLPPMPAADLGWLRADVRRFHLPARYALLLPGGRAEKRWPVENYGALAQALAARGVTPVLLGVEEEAELTGAIGAACPAAVDLAGRTTVCDIATLGQRAVATVGGNLGALALPMAAGCRAVVLFAGPPTPILRDPPGRLVMLQRERLDAIPVEDVVAAALT